MKKIALFILVFLPAFLFAEGPHFRHKDSVIQQEFDNVYRDLRSVLSSSATSKCIDSPTFCVDANDNSVGIGTNEPDTKLHLYTSSAEDVQLLIQAENATGDPFITFNANNDVWSLGTDNSDSGKFILSNSNALGTTNILAISGNDGVFRKDYYVARTNAGGSVLSRIENASNTSGSNAIQEIFSAGSSAGDAFIRFSGDSGVANFWSLGLDRSANASIVLSSSSSPGTGNAMSVTTSSFTISYPAYIKGTTTNDNACTGCYGEYVSSAVTTLTNYPTSAQYGDAASITLTAGDWNVTARIAVIANGATVTDTDFGISSVSGNSSSGLVVPTTNLSMIPPTASYPSWGEISNHRVTPTTTTTYYLKIFGTYSVATPRYRAILSARRMR